MPLVITAEQRQKIKSILKQYQEHIAAIINAPVFLRVTLLEAEIKEDLIRNLVCMQFDKDWPEIIAKDRKRELVTARMCYAFLCKKYLDLTFKVIGENLGGQDHTTAMSLYNNAINYLGTHDFLTCANLIPLIKRLDEIESHKTQEHALEI